MDRLKEACGIFGVYGHPEASNIVYLGLYALQHRGQESAGIVSYDGKTLYSHRQMGLVNDIFNEEILKRLPGHFSIGHVRYSTSGISHIKNAQPFLVEYSKGGIAVAHNGNLVNAQVLRELLEQRGAIFQSTMDTEVIIHLIAHSQKESLVDKVIDALSIVKGAYSLLFLNEREMIAARDPLGFRPLVLGKLKNSFVVSSETCALDLIEAEYIREVEPGEIILINENGLFSYHPFKPQRRSCVFELIYFARPDSLVFGRNVYEVRKEMGRILARESPIEADMIMPVPDSGIPASIGFSQKSEIPFETGLIRNHYVGRTFIEPQQSIRHFGVKIKLNALKGVFNGKRIVLVDDSIVRGTTSQKIIKMIQNAGAKEVHVRISSPPIIASCFFGIDTPTKGELIASSHGIEEINRFLGSDSLFYLSLKGLKEAVKEKDNEFCYACFTEDYPVERDKAIPTGSLFDKEKRW